MPYPVTFDIQRPERFDKTQVFLRALLWIIVDGIVSILYFAAPVLAAILISQQGGQRYIADAESGPTKWLRYLMGFYSYLALASDKLSAADPGEAVRLDVQANGTPTVGSALLRLILAIPHAIVLALLGFVFFFVWIIAAVSILFNATYPKWAADFIRGYLRWTARVYAYLGSLVEEYPPFSFGDGEALAAPLSG